MEKYFHYCLMMFVLGVMLLVGGSVMKSRLKPKVAAVLVLVGAVVAMIFMNICLSMYLLNTFS